MLDRHARSTYKSRPVADSSRRIVDSRRASWVRVQRATCTGRVLNIDSRHRPPTLWQRHCTFPQSDVADRSISGLLYNIHQQNSVQRPLAWIASQTVLWNISRRSINTALAKKFSHSTVGLNISYLPQLAMQHRLIKVHIVITRL